MADDPNKTGNAKPVRLRPTIINPPVRPRAAKRAKDAPTETPFVTTPTAIPGVERRRIGANHADMVRLGPGAEPRVCARALRLVEAFVPESAREEHVPRWGQEAEKDAERLVAEALDLAKVEVMGRATGYVGRIGDLLAAIDIDALREGRRTPLLGAPAALAPIIDTSRKLASARSELRQLVSLARDALDPLKRLRDALDSHARAIADAILETEAAALAASFLAEHLTTQRPDLSRRFVQREMDLTQTALRVRDSQFERERQLEAPRALITKIQDVVLLPLPDWLDGADALASAASARRLTPTEAGELQHRLRAILRNLEA